MNLAKTSSLFVGLALGCAALAPAKTTTTTTTTSTSTTPAATAVRPVTPAPQVWESPDAVVSALGNVPTPPSFLQDMHLGIAQDTNMPMTLREHHWLLSGADPTVVKVTYPGAEPTFAEVRPWDNLVVGAGAVVEPVTDPARTPPFPVLVQVQGTANQVFSVTPGTAFDSATLTASAPAPTTTQTTSTTTSTTSESEDEEDEEASDDDEGSTRRVVRETTTTTTTPGTTITGTAAQVAAALKNLGTTAAADDGGLGLSDSVD